MVGMLYPLHAINLSILKIQGRSDIFLKLEIIKNSLAIPVIIIGVVHGVKYMILSMIVITIIAYYLNSYWYGKYFRYGVFEQIKDIFPSL